MNKRAFNELTDWIGIPLVVLLVVVLVVIDVRSIRNKFAPPLVLWLTAALLTGAVAIIAARFIRLA